MANAFDFELNADENVTKVIDEINAKLNGLNPNLAKTQEWLKFGGSKSTEGVDTLGIKLRNMSRYAKDNVQYLGDMVPPLKNFGELATKYGGIATKLGGVGVAAYGASKAFENLVNMGKEAYELDVSAKNSAMSVPDFTRLQGALIQIGVNADDAKKSVESFYGILNHPLQGRRDEARAQLTSMGVPLYENEHGTIDAYKTFPEVVKAMQKYPSDVQNTIAEKIGLDEHGLALARKGPEKYQKLLAGSDWQGHTRSQADNDKLNEFNDRYNNLNSWYEGTKTRLSIVFAKLALSETDIIGDLAGRIVKRKIDDFAAIGRFVSDGGFSYEDKEKAYKDKLNHKNNINNEIYHGNKKEDLRKQALRDKVFRKSLSYYEDFLLSWGSTNDDLEKKINDRYGAAWEAEKRKREGYKAPNIPTLGIQYPKLKNKPKIKKDSFGLRIKNPGNVRDAPNGIGYVQGKNGTFVKFGNNHDGLSALARQLMLYGDRGKNTVDNTISTYAPAGGVDRNNTQEYINFVSNETGFLPNQQLDMHDPKVLENLMVAMIKQENHGQQPFSQKEITDAITAAIFDPKWQGLRDKYYLGQQRMVNQPVPPESDKRPSSIFANQADNSEIAQNISDAIQSAIGENKLQVEITIVSNKTGERQQFNAKTGGRVTTSMQYP
ncbi:hypothetical protein LGZ99_23165 [Photorhabdus temperata]|uniref:Uncharacterized protein n=2 Tax=Photorhabdus TaxID=29487 RepID=A0A7X5TJT1_9GAMM|nr:MULTISPECIES: hypothetical protein [Photorhabdus]KER01542.1 hypothetical protein MEG1DRAFT_03833 [Photorhabdus temperata subsp. temperata Meg1]MCT8350019.1 hypothetical protein [Photorhabdus temperata]NHB94654.1 hypothetical protein [Photorhabdus cinerea]